MFSDTLPAALKGRGLAILLCVGLAASCKQSGEPPAVPAGGHKGLLKIAVANYPLAYFAERIGGTEVSVVFSAPADIDPAFWEPTTDDIAAFQDADLILMNGAGYSKWADKASLPESRVVDTSAAFGDQLIETKGAMTHSHGKQGEHSHDGIAFTTWIDFSQALQQADAIREILQKRRPEQIELFALNFDLLKRDLLELDNGMKEAGRKLAGHPVIASHPIYQYWARRYQINLQSVLWEPDSVPNAEQMNDLKSILTGHSARWFVWEGEPVEESVKKISELGLASVVFDPCANKPVSGNWLTVMSDNLRRFKEMTRTP